MLVVATRPPTARSRAEQQLFKNITKHRSALLCCEVDTLSLEQTRKSNFSSSLRLQLYGRRLTTTIGLLFSAVVVVVGPKTKITQNCICFYFDFVYLRMMMMTRRFIILFFCDCDCIMKGTNDDSSSPPLPRQ